MWRGVGTLASPSSPSPCRIAPLARATQASPPFSTPLPPLRLRSIPPPFSRPVFFTRRLWPPKNMRVPGDLLVPVLVLRETNNGIPHVLQAIRVLLVAPAPLGIVVIVPIDIDCHLVILVVEVRPRPAGLDQVLRVRRQPQALPLQQAQPGSLQLGTGQPQQLLEMYRARLFRWASDDVRLCQIEQFVANSLAIKQEMLALVVIVHQAIVTGRLTVLQRAGSAA